MRILGIETSCDETSAAVVADGCVLSSAVSSQVDFHAVYGGVVPEVASRQHLKLIDAVVRQALTQGRVHPRELDAVAVTRGPGLPSALLVGVAMAKGLAARYGKPLAPVHHLEAHLYSSPIDSGAFVALVVSGGHTMLIHAPHIGGHRVLGSTVDDAAGEAFDKVAQMLGLPYPGGPVIELQAAQGNPRAFDFPRPMLHSGDWNFSFSGLKTAVRRTVGLLGGDKTARMADLCASFQLAVVEVLVEKTLAAAKKFRVRQIAVSGGVACNGSLRQALEKRCQREGMRLRFAEKKYCTDNAAMVALLAERKLSQGWLPPDDWDIQPDWRLESRSTEMSI
ncbi:MAG: tRNA (adenosine(37)-N6)-threonylcarbamoyltransferase complex transferase subunit TsaD [Verrucomicrobiae bacterium]|nr:tRNA (adenosine(37)-N6)-threonylcarbamoyltransferase complex transferase subunit TsaD [Verrucomicrobiae bacterium]